MNIVEEEKERPEMDSEDKKWKFLPVNMGIWMSEDDEQ